MNPIKFNPEKIIKRTSYFTISMAFLLISIKFMAWYSSKSLAVGASLIDSFSDFVTSLVNLLAIYYAFLPADEDHKFGHGKAEALAGLVQSFMIIISTVLLAYHTFKEFNDPQPINNQGYVIGVMGASICIIILMVLVQSYAIKKTDSLATKADSLHYKTDLLANFGVVFSVLLSTKWPWLDPLCAVLIIIYISHSTFDIIKQSFDVLMDRELPHDFKQEILTLVKSHADVIGVHDLRTRSSGHSKFIQMHLDLHADISLKKAHKIAEEVEEMIINKFKDVQVIIHQDPFGYEKKNT